MASPADRGTTKIADRVVAKIAAQAAREALHAAWREPGAGPGAQAVPRGHDCAPHAAVSLRGAAEGATHLGQARVRVAVELGYPSDIGAQCAAVRQRVAARVEQLAGMEVPKVVVEVERLHSWRLSGGDVGRVR